MKILVGFQTIYLILGIGFILAVADEERKPESVAIVPTWMPRLVMIGYGMLSGLLAYATVTMTDVRPLDWLAPAGAVVGIVLIAVAKKTLGQYYDRAGWFMPDVPRIVSGVYRLRHPLYLGIGIVILTAYPVAWRLPEFLFGVWFVATTVIIVFLVAVARKEEELLP